jgi:hypothetical protein
VIFANTVAISHLLADLAQEGDTVPWEAVAALSPYMTAHIIRFGRYTFDRTRRPPPLEVELPPEMASNVIPSTVPNTAPVPR